MLPEAYIRFISNQLATAQLDEKQLYTWNHWPDVCIEAYKALEAVTAYAENQPMIYFDRIIELIRAEDGSGIRELQCEMTKYQFEYVWQRLDNHKRGAYRRLLGATVQTSD